MFHENVINSDVFIAFILCQTLFKAFHVLFKITLCGPITTLWLEGKEPGLGWGAVWPLSPGTAVLGPVSTSNAPFPATSRAGPG